MPRFSIFGSSYVRYLKEYVQQNPQKWKLPYPLEFYGKGGMRTDHKITPTLKRALDSGSTHVLIVLGGNDIGLLSPKQILGRLLRVRQNFLDAGAQRVFVGAILPRGSTRNISVLGFKRARRRLNRLLRKQIGSDLVVFERSLKFPKFFLPDLVHPNKRGCHFMMRTINHIFKSC